jgi:hypothetical protein
MNSDEGDFNYEKMIEKFCSPIQTKYRNEQLLPCANEPQTRNSKNDISQVNLQEPSMALFFYFS